MRNAIFIGENLDRESNTSEFVAVLSQSYLVHAVDLTREYRRAGSVGLALRLEAIINSFCVTRVFFVPGASKLLHPRILENWRKCAVDVKIICIFSDPDYLFHNNDFYYAQYADVSLIFGPTMGHAFQMYDLRYVVGQFFETEIYCDRELGDARPLDISFVGGVSRADRKDFLRQLAESGLNVWVAGYGSERGIISRDEKNMILKKSLLHLSFSKSHAPGELKNQRLYGHKSRPIEALLSGSLPICEYEPSLTTLYGSDVPIFKTANELVGLIQHLLSNRREVVRRRKSMLEHYMRDYSNSKILSELENKLSTGVATYSSFVDDGFMIHYLDQRFYYFGYFLTKLQLSKALNELLSVSRFSASTIRRFIYHGARGAYLSLREMASKWSHAR